MLPSPNMKRLLLSLFLLGTFSLLPAKAYADCQALYGGGQTCTSYNFSLQKFVQVPNQSWGNFVNNLSVNDPKYSLSQTVNFQIVITNTGSNNISSVTIADTFPQFVSFVAGPGSFNTGNNTLTFVVYNLNVGQSQTFNLSGKIANSGVPQGITCVVNQAAGTDNNGDTNTASSQLCIQNVTNVTPTPVVLPVVQVRTTPPTGPEMLPLALLFPGGLAGIFLRKRSKKLDFKGGEK
ncbi:MAG: hypothetical protein ABSD69_02505 [Candidatus Levyibacteriota bacterium]